MQMINRIMKDQMLLLLIIIGIVFFVKRDEIMPMINKIIKPGDIPGTTTTTFPPTTVNTVTTTISGVTTTTVDYGTLCTTYAINKGAERGALTSSTEDCYNVARYYCISAMGYDGLGYIRFNSDIGCCAYSCINHGNDCESICEGYGYDYGAYHPAFPDDDYDCYIFATDMCDDLSGGDWGCSGYSGGQPCCCWKKD
jgi:hypothetical protein